jgi:hypothetical protein
MEMELHIAPNTDFGLVLKLGALDSGDNAKAYGKLFISRYFWRYRPV